MGSTSENMQALSFGANTIGGQSPGLNFNISGAIGSTGATGPTGPTGPEGAAAEPKGTIIPFSTSDPISIIYNTSLGSSDKFSIGFGNGELLNDERLTEAISFCMPRDGIITSISAKFRTSATEVHATAITVFVQLYLSPIRDVDFVPIESALVGLSPQLSEGIVPEGNVVEGFVDGLSIILPAETKIALICYAIPEDTTKFIRAFGTLYAGVRII